MRRTLAALLLTLGSLIVQRANAATIIAVTSANDLVRFNSSTPGTIISSVPITGLAVSETLAEIAFRPATGELFGLGSTSRLYTINVNTGVATVFGSPGAFTLSGLSFGFGFIPTVDRIRVTSDSEQNMRLNPTNGTLSGTDTPIVYVAADPSFGLNPDLCAISYTNKVPGTPTTLMYGIDTAQNSLVFNATTPNNGQLTTVGALGVNPTDDSTRVNTGFDILTRPDATSVGLAALTTTGLSSSLYSVNLSTGTATLVGSIGPGGAPLLIRAIAILVQTRFDHNGDKRSDILLRNQDSGDLAEYQMNGLSLLGAAVVGNPGTSYSVVTIGDYDGDGRSDLAMQNSATNDVAIWLLNGNAIKAGLLVGNPGAGWKAVGSADFNGDGRSDIVLYNTTTGNVAAWLMNGGTILSGAVLGSPGTGYVVAGAADFNGDEKADILLQNPTTGDMAEWQLNGVTITAGAVIGGAGAAWKAKAVADANGDGKADIFLRNETTGDIAEWQMNGFTIASGAIVGSPGTVYDVPGSADYNADGKSDLLLRRSDTGDIAMWLLNGSAITAGNIVSTPGTSWSPAVR